MKAGQFENFEISKETQKNLKKKGISGLFPIQVETYDTIFTQKNVIGFFVLVEFMDLIKILLIVLFLKAVYLYVWMIPYFVKIQIVLQQDYYFNSYMADYFKMETINLNFLSNFFIDYFFNLHFFKSN